MVEETKHERFIRLAESRTQRALKSIQVIGNLSNRSRYEYSDQDIERIVGALRREVRTLEQRFNAANSRNEFKLR